MTGSARGGTFDADPVRANQLEGSARTAAHGLPTDPIEFERLLSSLVSVFTSGFEQRMGYPAGSNHITRSSDDSSGLLTDEFGADGVPLAVRRFFDYFTEIHLPDLWNGYFIGPASWSVAIHRDKEPRWVRVGSDDDEVMVVASDGGGTLFALPVRSGSPVYRLPPSLIAAGTYEPTPPADTSRLVVASDFDDFLARFLDGVDKHVNRGAPGPFAD